MPLLKEKNDYAFEDDPWFEQIIIWLKSKLERAFMTFKEPILSQKDSETPRCYPLRLIFQLLQEFLLAS